MWRMLVGACALWCCVAGFAVGGPLGYDPLAVSAVPVAAPTFEVLDKARQRVIPVRVYLPENHRPAPVILFSHGLGGSRDNNPYLGNQWARRGYVVVFLQHPGSDESVWKDVAPAERTAAMKKAISVKNFMDRNKDVAAVIDVLKEWNAAANHPLRHRLDLLRLGMAGHSFGAKTTQVLAGQAFLHGWLSYRDPRIQAAVMMSPGPPATGDPAVAFAPIRIPCLLMTGTRDSGIINDTRPADRWEWNARARCPARPDAGNHQALPASPASSSAGDSMPALPPIPDTPPRSGSVR